MFRDMLIVKFAGSAADRLIDADGETVGCLRDNEDQVFRKGERFSEISDLGEGCGPCRRFPNRKEG